MGEEFRDKKYVAFHQGSEMSAQQGDTKNLISVKYFCRIISKSRLFGLVVSTIGFKRGGPSSFPGMLEYTLAF